LDESELTEGGTVKIITVEEHQARYIEGLLRDRKRATHKEMGEVGKGTDEHRQLAAEIQRIDLISLALKDAESR
jgi:hypothetical protein